jgi:AsmA protein
MRMLKIAGVVVGSLVVLFVVALIAAALLIDPNAYKGRIEREVQQSTGRALVLSGDLHLHVFPWIALRLGPASLGNPPGFPATPFVTLQQASLRVRLLPLLHGELQIGHVEIDGLDARLLRDAQGRGNWESLSGSAGPASPASPTIVARTPGPAGGSPSAAGASAGPPLIAGLSLRDARISYNGLVIAPLNVTVGQVASGVAIPVRLQLQMQRTGTAPPLTLSGSLQLTWQPAAITVSALDLQLDQSRLRGEVAIAGQEAPALNFNLNVDQLDLDRYRTPTPASAPAAAAQASGTLPLPTSVLKTLQLDGTLAVGTLTLDHITLNQLSVHALARDGVAHLMPVSGQLYGGTYHGEVTVDARDATPALMLDQSLAGVDMARLLKDFEGTGRLSGSGNLTAMLTAQGPDTDALLHTLAGQVVLDVNHGAIEGIDLPFEVQQATALVQRHALSGGQGSGRTSFETFHATAMLHDGVADTRDLDIATQLLRVRGQGTLNLLSDAVSYQLQVAVLKAPASAGASATTLAQIPLNVSGTLASLQVRPDIQQLARSQLRQQLQQHGGQLQQKVQGALKGLFGGSKPR